MELPLTIERTTRNCEVGVALNLDTKFLMGLDALGLSRRIWMPDENGEQLQLEPVRLKANFELLR